MKAAPIKQEELTPNLTAHHQQGPRLIAWAIWFSAALFYLYEYVLRASPSVMTSQLMNDFGVTSTSLGILSSMYYYAYTPLQIPCGIIVDRLGARIVITLSCLLCISGTYFFAISDSLLLAEVGRFLIGAGSACAYLSTLKLSAEWFPPRYFAILSALTNQIGIMFGGFIVSKPLVHFVSTIGWRETMHWAAILGIAVLIICWSVIRSHPPKEYDFADHSIKEKGLLEGLKVVMRNKQVWYASLYGSLFYIPIAAFTELWGVPFLMQKYTITNENAASITMMLYFGFGVGALILAFVSDYMKKRLPVMKWSAIFSAIIFMLMIYLPDLPMSAMYIMMLLAGGFNGAQVLCFAVNQESNPASISGTTVGFTNMVVMVSGIIFQPFLGMLLDLAWDGKFISDGIRFYSEYAYQIAMVSIPLSLMVAYFVVFFMKETYPLHAHQRKTK